MHSLKPSFDTMLNGRRSLPKHLLKALVSVLCLSLVVSYFVVCKPKCSLRFVGAMLRSTVCVIGL